METESIIRHKISFPKFIKTFKIKGRIESITVPPNQKGKTLEDKYILVKQREGNGKSTA